MMSSKLSIVSLLALLALSCNRPDEATTYVMVGDTQGTTYRIKYWGDSLANYQSGIDSLLLEIDTSLSTYLPGSIISQVNAQKSTVVDAFFSAVFTRSVEINKITGGAFDPSVMPLVSAWGFGPAEVPQIDTTLIDSLRSLVGLSRFGIYFSLWKNAQNIKLDTSYLIKTINEIQLDFNGIAQGYSVDVLAAYLEHKTVTNYLIEVGGEIKAKGANPSGERWLIGIDKPEDHLRERPLQATVALMDNAIATSGSYRKFYELNGTKYSHTIDPFTGYPVTHSLLSATVMTQECMSADAYATAFMVMGLNSSRRFLEQHEELALEAYFIYADENGKHLTYTTPGLEMLLNEDL
jgi:thiamine biosynthesis lipoprotein